MVAMKVRAAAAAFVLCFASVGFASHTLAQTPADGSRQAAEEADSPYTVVRADASIPFAGRSITGYRVGLDRSLILDVVGNRWYRATLDRPCARDLRWEFRIGIRIPSVNSLRENDQVIVDGRRCFILSLDEIADPREVEHAARAAREAEKGD
jgi:hypothetical protein